MSTGEAQAGCDIELLSFSPVRKLEIGIWGARPDKERGIAQRVRHLEGKEGEWPPTPSDTRSNIPSDPPWGLWDPCCPIEQVGGHIWVLW